MVLNTYKTGSGSDSATLTSTPLASTALTFSRSTGDDPYLAMKSMSRATPTFDSAAVQNRGMNDCRCTAAESNVGVARLMDFIAKYGSSPVDREKVKAVDANGVEVSVALSDPDPVLYVFKTMSEAQFGDLSFFRLYSGSVHLGKDLYNSDRKAMERFGQIYLLNGKNPTSVERLNAGDITAVVKLKHTPTA